MTKELSVKISEADFPKPFYQGLEFNAPAHGSFNIVHIGMLLPAARQIYVCAQNCMRGVVLTAIEMNAADRFSFVLLEESDLLMGNLEELTIEGVSSCLDGLEELPPVVLLFTVCIHHFLGSDLDYIYETLEKRYPNIVFCRCYMDPLLQKSGPTPDQKLRAAMIEPIEPLSVDAQLISLIGGEYALAKNSDIYRILSVLSDKAGSPYRLLETAACDSYETYLSMGKSALIFTDMPGAKLALELAAKKLSRPVLYLPKSFDYTEISSHWYTLSEALLDINGASLEEKTSIRARLSQLQQEEIASCEHAFSSLLQMLGDTEIRIDASVHPRPLGLARALLSHGFFVSGIYIDVINEEEEADFAWLREHAKDVRLISAIEPEARTHPRCDHSVLAIGQKAAWFCGTKHFVNLVNGGGLFGYDGIRSLLYLIKEAYLTEKNTEALIVRKGWGCESCV